MTLWLSVSSDALEFQRLALRCDGWRGRISEEWLGNYAQKRGVLHNALFFDGRFRLWSLRWLYCPSWMGRPSGHASSLSTHFAKHIFRSGIMASFASKKVSICYNTLFGRTKPIEACRGIFPFLLVPSSCPAIGRKWYRTSLTWLYGKGVVNAYLWRECLAHLGGTAFVLEQVEKLYSRLWSTKRISTTWLLQAWSSIARYMTVCKNLRHNIT